MKVNSDEEAIRLMNDSEFGLTAAIYSADAARAEALGDLLETGTVFLNPLRLPGSRTRLDGSQKFGPRLHIVERRLRTTDSTQVIPFQGDTMSVNLRGNWNYPTTIWAGPGRIAELAEACAKAGMQRPLIVTDEGLAKAPMILSAQASLKDAGLFSAVRGNPASSHVEAGLKAYHAGHHDGVVAFGRRLGIGCRQGRGLHVGADSPLMGFRGYRRLVDSR